MQKGFSLVELSIVLVILGLLTGGILAGQSLIRAAELRAVTTEYARHTTAIQSFRDRYFALPGDMTNATAFWGHTGVAGCTNRTGTSGTSPGTCDGNGDGYPTAAPNPYESGEIFQIWRHLALAGLVEGQFSGLANNIVAFGGGFGEQLNLNVPSSKVSSAGWEIVQYNNAGGTISQQFNRDYRNWLGVGANFPSGILLDNPIFKPEEAWNIDTKVDDGRPGQGGVQVATYSTCTTATWVDQTDRPYNLSLTSIACSLRFKQS